MDKHAIDSLTPADENSCDGKKSTVQHRIYKITTTYVDKQTNQLRKIKNFGFMQKYGNSVRVSVELHKRGGKKMGNNLHRDDHANRPWPKIFDTNGGKRSFRVS